MAVEYDCTCRACGHKWFYNDVDLKDVLRLLEAKDTNTSLEILSATKSRSVAGAVEAAGIFRTVNGIPQLDKCPACNAGHPNIVANKVDNWLLDNPSSPFYLDHDKLVKDLNKPHGFEKILFDVAIVFIGFGIILLILGGDSSGIGVIFLIVGVVAALWYRAKRQKKTN